MRRLGANSVQGERRKQADNSCWNGRGDHRKRLELAWLGRRQAVEAGSNLLHDPTGNQTPELREWDLKSLQVARSEEGPYPRSFEPGGGEPSSVHGSYV